MRFMFPVALALCACGPEINPTRFEVVPGKIRSYQAVKCIAGSHAEVIITNGNSDAHYILGVECVADVAEKP